MPFSCAHKGYDRSLSNVCYVWGHMLFPYSTLKTRVAAVAAAVLAVAVVAVVRVPRVVHVSPFITYLPSP